MTQITSKTESTFPRAFGKAKREKPNVERLSLNEWRVGRYIVRFTQFRNRVFADCVRNNGRECKGFHFKGFCFHIAAALLSCQKSESRKAA